MEDDGKLKIRDSKDLPIFVKWFDFLKWLIDATDKFPKKVRFTLVDRIIRIALDVLEDLVQARYSRQKVRYLKRANLSLEKIRMLLRIAYEFRVMSFKTHEHAIRMLAEIGKMLGGWIKQQEKEK